MFVERLLELINEKGITKNKLLTDLSLSKNSFVDWGKRGTVPSGEVLIKLARYFNVSVDYLTGYIDKTKLETVEYPTIVKYRGLSEKGQAAVDHLLDELYADKKNAPIEYSDERVEAILQNSEVMRQLYDTLAKLPPENIKEVIRFVQFLKLPPESFDE